ncbi:C40 family peptidase [Streptosporangium sp. NBC_01756]|uniref:C40 family peptidase n=1 Tax=Streptosporangium sp. NBC_01756 TaxID=2975950 RepID=UPI002DD81D6F|nr:C40 family peptidase [Streptosporangium sp. NBC_01756]WSC90021.1 C40 family peptidase [Streptosporangium sp. NBC_01756]
MQSVERCGRTGVVVGLVCCLVTGVAAPAVAMRDRLGPSREEVARARSKAVERGKQLGETTALLAKARTTLGKLTGEARKLVEVYNRERIKAARAEELLRKARESIPATGTAETRRLVAFATPGGGATAIPLQPGGRATVIPFQAADGAAAIPFQAADGAAAIPLQTTGGAAAIPLQTTGGTLFHDGETAAGSARTAPGVLARGVAVGAAQAVMMSPPVQTAMDVKAGSPVQAAMDVKVSAPVQAAMDILQARRLHAEAAYAAQREAAERAATAERAAKEAVAGQTAEIKRIVAEKARLERRVRADTSAADRLAGRRQAVHKWSRIARQRARMGNRRSSAVARKRARFVAARRQAGSTWQAARGDIAADWALTQLDKPYVWAATGPLGYDCSGLTMQAWARAGVRIDHWTGTQWTSGQHVQITRLRRGDLLFFGTGARSPGDITHVGIYIGRGLMVHAPQTGDVVRVAPIWRGDLIGATRPT